MYFWNNRILVLWMTQCQDDVAAALHFNGRRRLDAINSFSLMWISDRNEEHVQYSSRNTTWLPKDDWLCRKASQKIIRCLNRHFPESHLRSKP